MKLLNRCKKHRNKPVQLTIASIIISYTHAPLQLCIVTPNYITIAMTVMVIITICGTTIQSCSGAWVWLIIILAIVQACSYAFTPVQQFHPACFCTFYLFNSVHFKIFLKNF